MSKQKGGDLAAFASADGRQYFGEMAKVERHAAGFGNRMKAVAGTGFGDLFRAFSGGLLSRSTVGAASAGAAVYKTFSDGVRAAAGKEKAGLSFELLVGKDAGSRMLETVDRIAFQGGLDPQQMRDGVKSLPAGGAAAGDLLKTVTGLAKVSIAAGASFGHVARAVGQIAGKGELMAEEVNGQLIEAGFPVEALLKASGASNRDEFNKKMEGGELKSDVVFKALAILGDGKFADALKKNADTFEGAVNQVSQAWGKFSAELVGAKAGGLLAWAAGRLATSMNYVTAHVIGDALVSIGSVNPFADRGAADAVLAARGYDRSTDPSNTLAGEQGGGVWGAMNRYAGEAAAAMKALPGELKKFGSAAGEVASDFAFRLKEQAAAPRTALQGYQQRADMVGAAAGLRGMNPDAIGTARADAFLALEHRVGSVFETRLPQAVARGSVEAESILNRADVRTPPGAEQRVAAVLERANKLHEQQLKELADLRRAVERLAKSPLDRTPPKDNPQR